MFMLAVAISFSAMAKTVVAITEQPYEKLTQKQQVEYDNAIQLKELESRDARTLTSDEKQTLEILRLLKPRSSFAYVNENILIIVVAIVVVIYAVMGGLEAAFLTDTIQGVFIIILSLILFPFTILKINEVFGGHGFSGVVEAARSHLPGAMFELWGSPLMLDFTWYFSLTSLLMITINTAVQANQLVCAGSAKDEYTARYGFCAGIYIKRVTYLFWGVTALMLIILYQSQTHQPDYIWGLATRDLLGGLGFGLVGLMIACLMAALMSTADCLMLTSSSLMTHNFFKPLFPACSEMVYIWMGRLFGALFIVGTVIIALCYDNIWDMIKFMWEFNISLAASFWLGMKWRRANRISAWFSMVSTLLFFLILPLLIPAIPGVCSNEYLMKTVEPIKSISLRAAQSFGLKTCA